MSAPLSSAGMPQSIRNQLVGIGQGASYESTNVTFDFDNSTFNAYDFYSGSIGKSSAGMPQDARDYLKAQGISLEEEQKYMNSQANSSVVASEGDDTDTVAEAEKKRIKNDLYTLTGTVTLNPTCTSLGGLEVGKTIVLLGLGKFLTGLYLITSKSVTLNSSGIAISIEVMKTGFSNTQINGA